MRENVMIPTQLCVIPISLAVLAGAASAIELRLPVECEIGRNCWVQNYVDHDASKEARDYACGAQTYDGHSGTDIRIPNMARQRAGVPVVAAADGRVAGVRDGMADVSIRAAGKEAIAGRECGNGVVVRHADGFETQYCHMAKNSLRVKPGEAVKAGQVLGSIGLSGNTEFAHLHLTVRQNGKVIDPFAYGAAEGACNAGMSLWQDGVRALLSYKTGAVLNRGFSAKPVTMEEIESGDAEAVAPGADAPALVAFVRAIGLRKDDVQQLRIVGPDGATLVDQTADPLDRAKAQYMFFAGRKRPPNGWSPGTYRATYSVRRGGVVALEDTFEWRL
jgi:hypothetical protein